MPVTEMPAAVVTAAHSDVAVGELLDDLLDGHRDRRVPVDVPARTLMSVERDRLSADGPVGERVGAGSGDAGRCVGGVMPLSVV